MYSIKVTIHHFNPKRPPVVTTMAHDESRTKKFIITERNAKQMIRRGVPTAHTATVELVGTPTTDVPAWLRKPVHFTFGKHS